MVRKPALELLGYLKNTNFAHPAVRYLLCILSSTPGPLKSCDLPSFEKRKCCSFCLWVWGFCKTSSCYVALAGFKLNQLCLFLPLLSAMIEHTYPNTCGREMLLIGNMLLRMFSLTYTSDGEKGTGKTLSLCHAVHFCAKHDWLILHIPDGKDFLSVFSVSEKKKNPTPPK